ACCACTSRMRRGKQRMMRRPPLSSLESRRIAMRILAVSGLALALLAGPAHAITLEQGQQQFDRMNAQMQEQADQLRQAQDQRNLMQQLDEMPLLRSNEIRMNQELRQLHRDNEQQLAPDDG